MKLNFVQPTAADIVEVNKMICEEGGNPHLVLNMDRVESAIHSAFYPGSAPFAYGRWFGCRKNQ